MYSMNKFFNLLHLNEHARLIQFVQNLCCRQQTDENNPRHKLFDIQSKMAIRFRLTCPNESNCASNVSDAGIQTFLKEEIVGREEMRLRW